MKSLIFEKKYNTKMSEIKTIQDIVDVVEGKSGKKVKFSQSGNLIMARGGRVFDIVELDVDPNDVIDKAIAKR